MKKSLIFLSLALLLFGFSVALANEKASSDGGSNFMMAVSVALFSGLIGYGVGVLKAFREYKQKVYQEILIPILTMAYKMNKGEQDEREFNQSLSKLWLYANKEVAKKTDRAVSIMHDSRRGDLTCALQEAIAAMRKDIQIYPWQKLDPSEVAHLYSQLSGQQND